MRALIDKQADVLQFCLNRGGFKYDGTFKGIANSVRYAEHPKTYDVLEGLQFHKSIFDIAATFDVGGKYPVDW